MKEKQRMAIDEEPQLENTRRIRLFGLTTESKSSSASHRMVMSAPEIYKEMYRRSLKEQMETTSVTCKRRQVRTRIPTMDIRPDHERIDSAGRQIKGRGIARYCVSGVPLNAWPRIPYSSSSSSSEKEEFYRNINGNRRYHYYRSSEATREFLNRK
jgi:hypothetical protein